MSDSNDELDPKDDIPDDYFNDLVDSKYLDELLSHQIEPDSTEQPPDPDDNKEEEITSPDDMDVEDGEREASGDADPDSSSSNVGESRRSPLMKRCLKEIDKLTKDIQRKKKKLQKELEEKQRGRRISESPTLDGRHYRSRSNERYNRGHSGGRSTSRRKSRSPRRRSRSRSRDRRRSRSRSRQRRDSRRSPIRVSPTTTKTMTFLEELDMKFAEQGQAFPEKDLILKMKANGEPLPGTSAGGGHRSNVPFGVAQPIQYPVQQHPQPPYPHEMVPQYPQPPHPGVYPPGSMPPGPAYRYPNPMAFRMPGGFVPAAPRFNMEPLSVIQQPQIPGTSIGHGVNIAINTETVYTVPDVNYQLQINPVAVRASQSVSAPSDVIPPPPTVIKQVTNKAQVIARCGEAIKILRAEENKVPKQRFLFTRTSLPNTNADANSSPLHTSNNVEFELTSKQNVGQCPMRSLTGKTKDICKTLGFNCAFIFSKMRMHQMANKVISEIDTKKAEIKKLEEKSNVADSFTQTGEYKCSQCLINDEKTYATVGTQKSSIRKISVRTQTDEEDYRYPLIQKLASMSAAQLIGMADFANLISSDRPTTAGEMFQLRERLVDIYNLGQRDYNAVKEAERKRKLEVQRGPVSGSPFNQMNSVSNMGGGGIMGGGGGGGNINMNDIANIAMNMGNINEMANIMANVNNMNLPNQQMNMRRREEEEQAEILRAEQIEREREMRYQQIRYEQEMRNNELEEERRLREMQMLNDIEQQGPSHNRGGGGWQKRGHPRNHRFNSRPSPWAN